MRILFAFVFFSSIAFAQLPSYVPTDSLVGWWPFCGNANDYSGNGNNGTVNGASLTIDRFGNADGAFDFNGSGDGINCGQQPILNNVAELTISLWLLADATNNYRKWVTKNIPTQQTGFGVQGSQGNFGVRMRNNINGYGNTDTSTFNTGVWYHVVMVFNGNGNSNSEKLKIFINGQENSMVYSSSIPSLSSSNNADLLFGKAEPNATALDHDGKLDDIGIWNRVLTLNEIQGLYNSSSGCCSPTAANDIQSACDSYTWIDGNTYTSSNNTATYTLTNVAGCDSVVTLDLTINSSPIIDLGPDTLSVCNQDSVLLDAGFGHATYSWNTGDSTQTIYASNSGNYSVTAGNSSGNQNNHALQFDGITNFTEVANGENIFNINTTHTLSAWIKPSTNGSWQTIFDGSGSQSTIANRNAGLWFAVDAGKLYTHVGLGVPQAFSSLYSVSSIDTSQWSYVTAVRDGSSLSLYINGVLDNQRADLPLSNVSFDGDVYENDIYQIGLYTTINTSLQPPWPYTGKIDNFELWNTALSQQEIQNYMNCSPLGNESGLVGYWNFEEGIGLTAFDQTLNGNDGIINGATYDSNIPLQNCISCISSDTIYVDVLAPSIDAGVDQIACLGCADIPDDIVVLTASPATAGGTYLWSPGGATTQSITVSPTSSTDYTVTYTLGCQATDTVTVFVGSRDCSSFTLTGLDSVIFNNQTYYQTTLDTVVHTNISGCDSIEYVDIIINHTGINENILKDVKVYPNPTSDIVLIKGINSLKDVSHIYLLDNKGALLRKIGINETQIDLSSFSTGIYFIEIKHQLGSGRVKVVRQ